MSDTPSHKRDEQRTDEPDEQRIDKPDEQRIDHQIDPQTATPASGPVLDGLGPELVDDDCDCVHPAAVMEARRALGDAPAAETMANLFAVLGDPTRMRVLTAIASGELCVSDLAVATGVNRTTISHQLRVLRAHRMVRRRRDGKVVYYALDDDHVAALLGMAAAHAQESDELTVDASIEKESA